jgi:hypothetical protein
LFVHLQGEFGRLKERYDARSSSLSRLISQLGEVSSGGDTGGNPPVCPTLPSASLALSAPSVTCVEEEPSQQQLVVLGMKGAIGAPVLSQGRAVSESCSDSGSEDDGVCGVCGVPDGAYEGLDVQCNCSS